jgi:thiol:disulfide interchange protein DsbA
MIRLFLTVLVTLGLATTAQAAAATKAAAPTYALGEYYQVVPTPSDPTIGDKIKVEEFFWYGCPHCYRFEPHIKEWLKKLPKDVQFVRVPNNLGHPQGRVHEQAFYIAQLLGIEDRIHQPFMDALVQDHMPLNDLPSVREFFVKTAHIKPQDFDGANGFMVDANMRRADQLAMDYQVSSVPTIVVGGKYLTEIGQPGIYDKNAGEDALYDKVLSVVDFLIAKVRDEQRHSPSP